MAQLVEEESPPLSFTPDVFLRDYNVAAILNYTREEWHAFLEAHSEPLSKVQKNELIHHHEEPPGLHHPHCDDCRLWEPTIRPSGFTNIVCRTGKNRIPPRLERVQAVRVGARHVETTLKKPPRLVWGIPAYDTGGRIQHHENHEARC